MAAKKGSENGGSGNSMPTVWIHKDTEILETDNCCFVFALLPLFQSTIQRARGQRKSDTIFNLKPERLKQSTN